MTILRMVFSGMACWTVAGMTELMRDNAEMKTHPVVRAVVTLVGFLIFGAIFVFGPGSR